MINKINKLSELPIGALRFYVVPDELSATERVEIGQQAWLYQNTFGNYMLFIELPVQVKDE